MVIEPTVRNNSVTRLMRKQIADEELLNRVLTTLEPFFVIAESGEPSPFKPTKELDQVEIASTIQQALALDELPEVKIDSASNPQGWLKETEEKADQYSLRDYLFIRLGANLWDSLSENLRVTLKVILWDSFSRDNLRDSLFYYLGFAIAGKQEMAEKLEPLVRIQTGCIVLGTEEAYDNTWLVLTA